MCAPAGASSVSAGRHGLGCGGFGGTGFGWCGLCSWSWSIARSSSAVALFTLACDAPLASAALAFPSALRTAAALFGVYVRRSIAFACAIVAWSVEVSVICPRMPSQRSGSATATAASFSEKSLLKICGLCVARQLSWSVRPQNVTRWMCVEYFL